MTRSLATLGVLGAMGLVTAAGCQKEPDGRAFRQALPEATEVAVKVPDQAAARLDSSQSALLGETAKFYELTRGVSRTLNGGTAWTLILVHTIASFPVTSVEGDTLIWGPWTDALDPAEYRLTATEADGGRWLWSLEGRRKDAGASAAFEPVVAGDAGDGHGTFSLDFDRAEALDPLGNDGQGQVDVVYDRHAREVLMDYARVEQAPGEPAQTATFHYEYREAPEDGGAGDFVFQIHDDLDENGSAWEDADVRSRWLASGAGRSDFTISSGDLDVTVTGSECWSTSFARVYFTASAAWAATEGDAASCAL
jgi:hypothetical protein